MEDNLELQCSLDEVFNHSVDLEKRISELEEIVEKND